MAASLGTAAASAASMTENVRKSSSYNSPLLHRRSSHRSSSEKVSVCVFATPKQAKLRLSSKALESCRNCSTIVRAQLNELAVDESSKAASSSPAKSEVSPTETILSTEASPASLASEEALSSFINQVSSLVKLVDSKDIVELRLSMLDCEMLIRKKEALPTPPATVMYVQSPHPPAAIPPAPVLPPVSMAAPSAPTPALSPPKVQPFKSSLPPLKCPMSGTLYRSPAPGEPPFVKVGDKVRKGQVLCIIEAMKLMNEIEADQSGTIVEILAEDGKPVSIDTPLFVIEP